MQVMNIIWHRVVQFLWPIRKDSDNPINQSKHETNTQRCCKAQETVLVLILLLIGRKTVASLFTQLSNIVMYMEVKSSEYELLLTLKDCSNWLYMRLYLLELTLVWFIKRSFVDWGHLTYVRISSLRQKHFTLVICFWFEADHISWQHGC